MHDGAETGPKRFAHRIATRDDLPEIVEVYNAAVASGVATVDRKPVSVASRRRWFDAHVPGCRPLWVVPEQGRVIAWLSFGALHGRTAYDGTAELSLYIREAFRRRGLGSYLIRAAVNHAPALGVDTLFAFVFAHNAPSLALFHKFGFARWSCLPGVVQHGQARDLAVLGRRV